MDQPIQYQSFDFALLISQLFSSDQTIVLSDIGPITTTGTLTDNDGVFYVGEEVTLDGMTLTMMGSGTATPGVDIGGITLPLGTPVDVLVFQDPSTDQLYLAYPDQPPSLVAAVAVVLSVDEVGYDTNTDTPLCFCEGTLVATPFGNAKVESLTGGDEVLDWSGARVRVLAVIDSRLAVPKPDQQPIVFEPGSLGEGLPERRLKLSPQHRLCLPGCDPAGADPFLGPALAFVDLPRVRQKKSLQPVNYVHLVTERHAILRVEGVPAESLLLRARELGGMAGQSAESVAAAIGMKPCHLEEHPASRPAGRLLTKQQAAKLVAAWQVNTSLVPGPTWPTNTGDVAEDTWVPTVLVGGQSC